MSPVTFLVGLAAADALLLAALLVFALVRGRVRRQDAEEALLARLAAEEKMARFRGQERTLYPWENLPSRERMS